MKKTTRFRLVARVILIALLLPTMSLADDDQPVNLKRELELLRELAVTFDNGVTDIDKLGQERRSTEEYFETYSTTLRRISAALDENSVIITTVQDQKSIIDELAEQFNQDSSVLGDEQSKLIQVQIAERRDHIDQTLLEIRVLKEQVDENVVELEALRLFAEYQLRLAQFDIDTGHYESAAQIMRQSVDGLQKVSSQLSAVSTSLTSQ